MRNHTHRCRHGFAVGLCVVATCKHWDGIRMGDEECRTKTPRAFSVVRGFGLTTKRRTKLEAVK